MAHWHYFTTAQGRYRIRTDKDSGRFLIQIEGRFFSRATTVKGELYPVTFHTAGRAPSRRDAHAIGKRWAGRSGYEMSLLQGIERRGFAYEYERINLMAEAGLRRTDEELEEWEGLTDAEARARLTARTGRAFPGQSLLNLSKALTLEEVKARLIASRKALNLTA